MNNIILILLLVPFVLTAIPDLYRDPIWLNGPESPVGQRLYHSLVQDSNGDIWTFGGEDNTYIQVGAEVWKLDVRNNFTWINITTTGDIPSARGGYALWMLNDVMYLFGGESNYYNPYHGSFYSLDTKTLQWTFLSNCTFNYESYGDLGVGNESTCPPKRAGAAPWVDAKTNTLWMFAGSGELEQFNDVWYYNVTSNIWTWVSGSPGFTVYGQTGPLNESSTDYSPPNWWYPQAAVDKRGDVWFYSGYTYLGKLYVPNGALWRFTPSTLGWAYMGGPVGQSDYSSGAPGEFNIDFWPTTSYGGNFVYSGNDILTYYGGESASYSQGTGVMDQVWCFNITLGQWAFISGNLSNPMPEPVYGAFQKSSPSNSPGSRMEFAVSGTIPGHLWIHGGVINEADPSPPVTSIFVLPVDLCITELNPCHVNATCASITDAPFTTCTCPSGYLGNGFGENGCTLPVPVAPPQDVQGPQAPMAQNQPQSRPTGKTSASASVMASFGLALSALMCLI